MRSLAHNGADVRTVAHIVHLSDPVAGASVMPSRRTPSMLAIGSLVMVSSFEGRRSRLSSSQ
jgi:hypothetical protein